MRLPARSPLVLAALALLALAPVPSSAQFGGLLRKAKEKLAQPGDSGEGAGGQQLDDALLGRLIVGLQAADPTIAKRDRVQADRAAKGEVLASMRAKNEAARSAYQSASSTINDCRESTIHSREEARSERMEAEMRAKASDPVQAAKVQLAMMKYGKAMAEAQQKNDPVLLAKAQSDMQRELMGDISAIVRQDSLAADAKCGKPVALPPELAEEEKVDRQIRALDDQLRVLEAQAANDGAASAGLDRVKYAELKERLHDIYQRARDGAGPGRYGSGEYAIVQRHRAEIDRLARTL